MTGWGETDNKAKLNVKIKIHFKVSGTVAAKPTLTYMWLTFDNDWIFEAI